MRHLGCELTDSDKIFIREETSKLQSSMPSNGFNISDSLNGFGMKFPLFQSYKLFIYKCANYYLLVTAKVRIFMTLKTL